MGPCPVTLTLALADDSIGEDSPSQTGWDRGGVIWALASDARVHVDFLSLYGLREGDQAAYFF